jgi:hypothetical protein
MVVSNGQTYILIPGCFSTYNPPSSEEREAQFYLAVPAEYIGTIQEHLNQAYESPLGWSDPNDPKWSRYTYVCPIVVLDRNILQLLSADTVDLLAKHALTVSETELQLHPSLKPVRAVELSIDEDLMDKVFHLEGYEGNGFDESYIN